MEVSSSILQKGKAHGVQTVHSRILRDTLQTKGFLFGKASPLPTEDPDPEPIFSPRPAVPLILGLIDLRTPIPSYHFSFTAFVRPASRPEGPCSFVVPPKFSFSPQVFPQPSLWTQRLQFLPLKLHKHCPFIPSCFSKGIGTSLPEDAAKIPAGQ